MGVGQHMHMHMHMHMRQRAHAPTCMHMTLCMCNMCMLQHAHAVPVQCIRTLAPGRRLAWEATRGLQALPQRPRQCRVTVGKLEHVLCVVAPIRTIAGATLGWTGARGARAPIAHCQALELFGGGLRGMTVDLGSEKRQQQPCVCSRGVRVRRWTRQVGPRVCETVVRGGRGTKGVGSGAHKTPR